MIGEWIALAAATSFAWSNIGIVRGARANDADNGVFLSLMLTAFLSSAGWLVQGAWRGFGPVSPAAIGWFMGAGALTGFVGRVLLYATVQNLGAVRASALRRLTPFFAVALAVGVLGEPMSPPMGFGMFLILASFALLVRMGMRETGAAVQRRGLAGMRGLKPGYFYGPISALGYATGALLRKLGLNDTPDALLGTAVGALVGLALFLLLATVHRGTREAVAATFSRYNGWLMVAAFASSFGQILSLVALLYTTVSRVVVVTSMEVYVTMFIARLMLGRTERNPGGIFIAASLGVAGTMLVALY